MKRIHTLDRCRAVAAFKEKSPLVSYEYERILELAIDCPLAGMPFDQASNLYPLFIPLSPQIRQLNSNPEVVSITLRFDTNQFIGIIGDSELKTAILTHPGAILFVVGNITKKVKGEHNYQNLRPRGWIIVLDREYRKRMSEKGEK